MAIYKYITIIIFMTFNVREIVCALSDYYSISETTNNNNSDWMSFLPNARSLRNMSIPGSHNSVSFYGGSYARCQTMPLSEQFKAGIRFLDIRCHLGVDNLPIYHGIMYQQTDFHAVLNATVTFLDEHPQEVIFMRIRQESKSSNAVGTLLQSIRNHVGDYPADRFWMSVNWPTLREARGKIVILQNFDSNYHVWVPYGSLAIDDHWNVLGISRRHVIKKWRYVREHLKKSALGRDPRIHLTWSSGASFMALPYAVAKRMNKHLWKLFRNIKWRGQNSFGIVSMDFPADVLIHKIIASNFMVSYPL